MSGKYKIWLEKLIKPVIMIHTGAGHVFTLSNYQRRMIQSEILAEITTKSFNILKSGGSRKAVVFALKQMESVEDFFNAGLGSKIQSDGKIRVSCALMDGARQKLSSVYNAEEIMHPSEIADYLLDVKDSNIDGTGVEILRQSLKIPKVNLVTEMQFKRWMHKSDTKTGTVGVVALDEAGNLFAGTSTGGKGYEFPGRVSDTPTPAGNFATKYIAVSATGIGEQIIDSNLCGKIAFKYDETKCLYSAMYESIVQTEIKRPEFGAIALTDKSEASFSYTTEGMCVSVASGDSKIIVM